MKKFLPFLLLIIFYSCGGSDESSDANSGNILENLSYTLDTLLVDSGDDFLNLSNGIFPNGLSDDLSRLYFFESNPTQLIEVDLDRLKVLKRAQFEIEGPDGVGDYISRITVGPSGNLFINSNSAFGIFDQSAKKLQNLKFVPTGIDSALAQDPYVLYSNSIYDFGAKKIYSQPTYRDAGADILLSINPTSGTAISWPVPKMKIVDDYTGTFTFESEQGTAIAFYFVGSYFTLLPQELIVSTSAMSGFYRLDTQTEKLEFVEINHHTVPNEMQVEIPQIPSSPEEVRKIQDEIFASVNYLEMLWDDTRKTYFRLGERTFPGVSADDPMRHEYHLFAYDREFKVLGETKLEGIDFALRHTFFKDGKLWSYVNVDDELGFAVFDFKF